MTDNELTAMDKIKRAKIQIYKKNPFFAYLSLCLKYKQDKGELPEYAEMRVDINGNILFKKEFVEKITNEQLEAVLCHEILHLALLHLLRLGGRNHEVFNIATDIAVNQILKENGFNLPEGCLITDYEDKINLFGQIIKDCNKKTAEEIYDEIKLPKGKKYGFVISGSGKKGEGEGWKRFDEHIQGKAGDGKDGKGKNQQLSPDEARKMQEYWKSKVEEAYVTAKLKGDVPKGIEQLIGKLHENKINWRVLLQRFIQNSMPHDFTMNSPHKKSVSSGYFMPNILKECIDVVVAIDASGSIGGKELNDFLSEITGMAKAFQGRIKIRVLTHDVDVHDDIIAQGNAIDKIKNMKVHGGGGTSHKPVFDYIKDKVKDCKVAIFLSDGYSDLGSIDFGNYRFKKLIVLSSNGKDDDFKDKNCKILKLKDN